MRLDFEGRREILLFLTPTEAGSFFFFFPAMADKDKEARAARESDAQSDMAQNSCLSDILKAITGLGNRMDNLQDQLNWLSQYA